MCKYFSQPLYRYTRYDFITTFLDLFCALTLSFQTCSVFLLHDIFIFSPTKSLRPFERLERQSKLNFILTNFQRYAWLLVEIVKEKVRKYDTIFCNGSILHFDALLAAKVKYIKFSW